MNVPSERDPSWPADILADSGNRLPLPRRDKLDEIGQRLYDRFTSGTSLAGLRGPGGIMMYSSKLAELSNAVNQYLRFESGLSGRVRELAILITAREHDSQFEWFAHEREAIKQGVPAEVVDIVKHRRGLEALTETDAAIVQLGREMFGQHKVSASTFARVHKIFGDKGIIDLVCLMGDYARTAGLLATFAAQLPPGEKPPLSV